MRRTRRLGLVCGVAVWLTAGCGREITVMSYNVANLFDATADGTEYEGSETGSVAEEQFRRKCAVVSAAIRRAVAGGPDVVALQEVENEGVLRALRDGWLRGMGYRWYVAAGGPPSATRVGVLSRLPVRRARSHLPAPGADGSRQRAVLEIELSVGGSTLYLLNNHWKSKIGGEGQTEPERLMAARTVADRVRRIMTANPTAEVLVAGDLNEELDEPKRRGGRATGLVVAGAEGGIAASGESLVLTGDSASLANPGAEPELFEPWLAEGAAPGSYAYGGVWYRPDHLLLGRGLFDDWGLRYRPGSFRVAALPLLMDSRTGLPKGHGVRGWSEYPDHLPILVTLQIRGGATTPGRARRG